LRYTKISGTFVKFDGGQRVEIPIAFSSQDLRFERHEIVVRTFGHGKPIETTFRLQAPEFLDFVASSDDSKIPEMSGHFFNVDYEECVFSASLPEQKVYVSGILTKLDPSHAISTKTLTSDSGKIVAVLQERVELISEDAFRAAIQQK